MFSVYVYKNPSFIFVPLCTVTFVLFLFRALNLNRILGMLTLSLMSVVAERIWVQQVTAYSIYIDFLSLSLSMQILLWQSFVADFMRFYWNWIFHRACYVAHNYCRWYHFYLSYINKSIHYKYTPNTEITFSN